MLTKPSRNSIANPPNLPIQWSDIRCAGYKRKLHKYTFGFCVDGESAIVQLTDKELQTPKVLVMRLQMALGQLIECPYMEEQKPEKWLTEVIFPLLKTKY